MQRLYSMFPIGLPGVGLLLLRLSLATSLWPIPHYLMPWLDEQALLWCVIVMSTALLAGALTPLAAGLGFLFKCMELIQPGAIPLAYTLSTALIAIAVFLLGPGAYSIDARLYGHRVLTLPPKA